MSTTNGLLKSYINELVANLIQGAVDTNGHGESAVGQLRYPELADPINAIERLLDAALWSHPRDLCMSYGEHCWVSMHFAARFAFAAACAVVHALVPCLFRTQTTDTIRWASQRIKTAGCHGGVPTHKE